MHKKLFSIFTLLIVSVALFAQTKKDDKYFDITKNLSVFNNVIRELDANFVDSLNYDKVITTGINSMLNSLDPYTIYYSENDKDELKMMTTGEYAGIGALISKNGKYVVISEPYEGLPAQKNGLIAGDKILEIDGKSAISLSTSKVSDMLKGKNNTQIVMKIKRPFVNDTITKTFLRKNILFHPVIYYTEIDNGVGYIMLKEFTNKAANEVKVAIEQLIAQHNIKSLIIDLRNNGGGLVDEAVKILGFFLPKGTTVVTTKGRYSKSDITYKTPLKPIFKNMKLAILVNSGSASASEILAGAVQDLDRGVIIGERTYGKGLIQSIRDVGYNGYVKLTTAKYYIPSGRCVQALDYSHKNSDGSVGKIPDSLMTEFRTKKGRIVKDGGGILPDTIVKDDSNFNIAFYLFQKNIYFDYATKYRHLHKTIASASKFSLTDAEYNDFVKYVIDEKKFTYEPLSKQSLKKLEETIKLDGMDKSAKKEFEALKAKLTPNVKENLQNSKKDVKNLLESEIVSRYYYQKGEVQYMLQDDKETKLAVKLLLSK